MTEEQTAQIIQLLTEIRDGLKPQTGPMRSGAAALRPSVVVTAPKFATLDDTFPPAPTPGDLFTYPGKIYGLRSGPYVQPQPLRWDRIEHVWRAVSSAPQAAPTLAQQIAENGALSPAAFHRPDSE